MGLSSTAFDFKENRYKYQGNEYLQKGLNWMDFHNRQYDPQLGRFLSVDPLAASTARFSPYTGMNDNPVSMVDPLGLSPYDNPQDKIIKDVTAPANVEGGKVYRGPSAANSDAFGAFDRDCAQAAFAMQEMFDRAAKWGKILGVAISFRGSQVMVNNGQVTGVNVSLPGIDVVASRGYYSASNANYSAWVAQCRKHLVIIIRYQMDSAIGHGSVQYVTCIEDKCIVF